MSKADIAAHATHLVMHVGMRVSHNNCPECRADSSRQFARGQVFSHTSVPADARRAYLNWTRERLDAIRTGTNGGDSVEAKWWYRNFMDALHRRITSHATGTGRKFAPEYAKYHMATYGNDWRFIHEN